MPLRSPFVRKARQAPPGGQDISGLVEVMTSLNDNLKRQRAERSHLPLDPEWQLAEFGPGFPIDIEPLDEPDAQGFVAPRIHQYPVQWNIPGRHDRVHVPWE